MKNKKVVSYTKDEEREIAERAHKPVVDEPRDAPKNPKRGDYFIEETATCKVRWLYTRGWERDSYEPKYANKEGSALDIAIKQYDHECLSFSPHSRSSRRIF